jgi:hypothetical protein
MKDPPHPLLQVNKLKQHKRMNKYMWQTTLNIKYEESEYHTETS